MTNTEYAKKLELFGWCVAIHKTQKGFLEELRDYTNYSKNLSEVSEEKYMNTNSEDYHNSVCGGAFDEDAYVYIEYKDGTHYSYYPALGIDGKFKRTGIKSAIFQDAYSIITYNWDLCDEWETAKEALTEEEENAIENGISLETLRLAKALTPAEETAKSTENSADDTTEEPEAEEQEATPAEKTANNTELNGFRYKINILDALKKVGYTSTRIRESHLFAQVTLQKFRKGDTNISLQTVADICYFTGLQPWDIIEYWEATKEEAEEIARKNREESKKELEESRKLMEKVKQECHLKGTENSAKETTEEE